MVKIFLSLIKRKFRLSSRKKSPTSRESICLAKYIKLSENQGQNNGIILLNCLLMPETQSPILGLIQFLKLHILYSLGRSCEKKGVMQKTVWGYGSCERE
jgi:hypothetical protein